MTISADNPIRRDEDDVLGRALVAESFAHQILAMDASEGLVVGVLGAWGSGKTSFVNLARAHLEAAKVPVLDFNPWMFSGAAQLVESFFIELASQLKIKPGLATIGSDLEEYGEAFAGLAWVPLVGAWIERGRLVSKAFAKMLQRRKEGTGQRRTKLADALRALDHPIVVVLDDIDRLTTAEIRDVFKLVRLTANFPNVIYLVAFDRKRVEGALAEQGIPGRDYLEKILQLGVDLPVVPAAVLDRQVFSAIEGAIAGVEPVAPFNSSLWPDIYVEIIKPLLGNMRDVRRFALAVHGTARDLRGQVELSDLLAMEAVRIFLPDVFALLPVSVDGLTETMSWSYGRSGDDPRLKRQVDRLIEAGGDEGAVVSAMIARMFPAAQRHVGGSSYGPDWKAHWLRERRVAHRDVLRLYLERVVGDSLRAFHDAEAARPLMTDAAAFNGFLRSLEPQRLEDVVASMETFEDEFRADEVVPSVTVLLNLLADIPERPRGFLEPDPRLVVARVVYRLLKALHDEDAVEDAVNEILRKVTSLSAQLEVISDVGHREGRGHGLASEGVAASLEQAWRDAVRAAPVDDLVTEPELLRVLYLTMREAEAGEDSLAIPDAPLLTAAILRSACSDMRSQGAESRAVHRSARLAWDVLVELYGDEATLRQRIIELKESDVEIDAELLELADRYLDGWRPEEFDFYKRGQGGEVAEPDAEEEDEAPRSESGEDKQD